MTKRECAIIMAYTGVCMLAGVDFIYFYKYIAEIMGRPVYTHELPELEDEIKERSKKDFIEICKNATDEAKPVKHGRWIETKDATKKRCSECDVIHLIAQYPHGNANYCPNCGEKMDGGEKND